MTTLLLGGRIYSPAQPDATAMAVHGPTVAWLGGDEEGRAAFPDADVVELDGGFVAPGFVDSHIHLTATGLSLTGLDLRTARSPRHCLQLVAEHAAAHPGEPVWGHGWDDSAWPHAAPPSTADLDAALGERPAYLARVDVHSALASTALRRRVPGLPAADGFAAQGPLTGDAHHLIRAAARDLLTAAQRAAAQSAALAAAAAHGVVAVHECAGPEIGGLDDWQQIRARSGAHGVEVTGYWGQAVTGAAQARALLGETGADGLAGDLFVDGALGSRTAWLHRPYRDTPHHTGNCYLDAAAITAHLRACTEIGVPAGFHVIGDAAVTAVVDALARVVDDLGVAAVARCGHRLEHLEMITAQQAARLGSWGVTASVQPAFDAAWGGADGMYAERLGADRGARLNPFALLASRGVSLAYGSDAPVTPVDPWGSVRAAVRHHTPGSAVSPRAAFAAATRGGWQAAGAKDPLIGTLAPGAPASYAVWDVDDIDAEHGLPRLDAADAAPHCRQTVHRGVPIHG